MTRSQAWAMANKLWPGNAIIRDDSGWHVSLGKYRVGYWNAVREITIVGYGNTWEAAFNDAIMRSERISGPDED